MTTTLKAIVTKRMVKRAYLTLGGDNLYRHPLDTQALYNCLLELVSHKTAPTLPSLNGGK